MTVSAHRARRSRPAHTRRARAALAAVALAVVLPSAACGFGAQTWRPYTPAEGVNFDVGDQLDETGVVHVRNLLIISRTPGSGIVSATIVTAGSDTLTSITGTPYKADGSKGAPFTADIAKPLQVANNDQVVLTDQQPFLTVKNASGLQAGLDAEVTVTFRKAGSQTRRTTVVDGNLSPYDQITPSASPSASPSVTAEPSPTP